MDHEKAHEAETLDAETTYEVIKREGERELSRGTHALAWSALAAGLSMGFSLVAEAVLHAHLPDAPWRILIAKLGYPIGFLIVTLGSQQLFTENTLTPIVPLLSKRSGVRIGHVGRLWAIVLAGNLVGAMLFAMAIAAPQAFEPEVARAFEELAAESMRGGAAKILIEGIFAGWLIALMVWMIPGSGEAKFLTIVVMTWLIGAAGLAHVIAGATAVLHFALIGGTSFGAALGGYILPALVGNIIGGVALVAAVNHAQVESD